MLYERWRQVARARRDAIALRDAASGRRWTFGELWAAGEAHQLEAGDFVCPAGNTPEFVIRLLGAWREGQVAMPLEPGQSTPHIPRPKPPCVHLKMTSATTGRPRCVAFTAEQLAADADNIVATMGLRPDWPNLGVISLAHSYGFSNLVLPLVLHGVPLSLGASPLPEAVRQAAAGEPSLTLAAVPALWRAWHEANAIPGNVRLAISAGAPLPVDFEQAVFKASGLKIHNFYGATECGGITYDRNDRPRGESDGVGTPVQHVELSVSTEGCLMVRSGAAGQTYWPEPEETLGGGIFRTSDLAEIKNGVVFLRGRLADQINSAGRKVSPVVIEQALLQHPAVRECLAFGVPSRKADRADTIVACVAAEPPVSGDALKAFLLHRLPAWQVPRQWWFVASLSTNSRGKISRAEWRDRFLKEKHSRQGKA